jgi:hypothetical protein
MHRPFSYSEDTKTGKIKEKACIRTKKRTPPMLINQQDTTPLVE